MLLLCATAHTATVTVDLKNMSGAPATEAMVIFDPQTPVAQGAPHTAVIDQVDKHFVPHVNVVQTGTSVDFPNADHIRHQVFSFSEAKKFSLKLYAGSPRADIIFDKPGLVVLGCNIHDSMVAFVGVVDTPYFATTGASGSVEINLPPGEYQLRIWHPNLKTSLAKQHVTVTAATIKIPLRLDLSGTGDLVAAWPE